ncbi:MAG: MBL fold metallo-hydrolase [Janthinobacterium lividum]
MFQTFEIGSLQATVLSDGFLTLPPPETVFPHLPPEAAREAVGVPGGVVVQLNCLLLDMGGRRLLFDCGLGETRLWGVDSGLLPRSMAEAEIDPATVDAVVLTHEYTDHCWGAVDWHRQLDR